MASIVKRRTNYSVVYYYVNEHGQKKQRWESFPTHEAAHKRKVEIEYDNCFCPRDHSTDLTIESFLRDFVSLYGEQKWGVSAHATNIRLIKNYITPYIGALSIKEVDVRKADEYCKSLKTMKSVRGKTFGGLEEYIGDGTIEKIYKLLRCAFGQAVKWQIIYQNPFSFVSVGKANQSPREIWDTDTMVTALDRCKDGKLCISLHLAFACSLRLGEILGLTWENVFITDQDILQNNAHIKVVQQLERVSSNSLEILRSKDILQVFPSQNSNPRTRLVMKAPKTKASFRKVWLPKTVALILRRWQEAQAELKAAYGDNWQNHDLVVCMEDGRPCEGRNINKAFKQLQREAGLSKVVFHSIRHTSTSYKLKLNHGDLKATQGDTGHAEADMIMRVYAHVMDEDRRINAKKMEEHFFANLKMADASGLTPIDDAHRVAEELARNPEIISLIREIFEKLSNA